MVEADLHLSASSIVGAVQQIVYDIKADRVMLCLNGSSLTFKLSEQNLSFVQKKAVFPAMSLLMFMFLACRQQLSPKATCTFPILQYVLWQELFPTAQRCSTQSQCVIYRGLVTEMAGTYGSEGLREAALPVAAVGR